MHEFLRTVFEGKRIVILGFGREGQSTYSVLRKILPNQPVTVADANPDVAGNPLLSDDTHLSLALGPTYLDGLDSYDLVLKSPEHYFHRTGAALVRNRLFGREAQTVQADINPR